MSDLQVVQTTGYQPPPMPVDDFDENSLLFEPVPSTVPFFTGDKFVNLICGPIGSSKTATGLVKIAYEAKRVAQGRDGIRRSRVAVIRNTRQMLYDTTIPDFLKWFPEGRAGTFMRTESKFILRFDDVECEVLFRGLDDANDVRRLLSLQLTFGVMDEFREIHQDIFEALQGRLGRYPDKVLVPPRPEWGTDDKGHPVGGCVTDDGKLAKKVWGMSNPPDMDTFWEEYLSNPPKNALVVTQPSGLSAEADWTHFLDPDFYANLAEGKNEDYVDVYIHAKFGKSLSGKPVFQSFNREFHVAKQELKPIFSHNSPLIIGVDAGLTPAAVIGQVDYSGRLMVYNALISDGMGALRFIRERLKPMLANKFAGFKVMVVIDPAAKQRAQTDEATVRDIYKAEGFTVRLARTNAVAARLSAVENYLTRTVDGKPLMLLCPEGAKELIIALASKYRYKVKKTGEVEDSPEKSHPWSDVCFVAGTPVLTPSGYTPVEQLSIGDLVCVPDGVDTVVATGSRVPSTLLELELSDGTVLRCTPDHPFYVKNHSCFLPANALQYEHVLATVGDAKWVNGPLSTRASAVYSLIAAFVVRGLKHLSGRFDKVRVSSAVVSATPSVVDQQMALSAMGCGSPEQAKMRTTGTSEVTAPLFRCISTFGSSITGLYQKGIRCITGTTTLATTTSPTLSLCAPLSTLGCTLNGVYRTGHWMSIPALPKPETPPESGISQKRVELGTGRTHQNLLRKLLTCALFAVRVILGSNVSTSGTTAPLRVIRSSYVKSERVFNLTTNRTHVYYAGPALVHNCDALQYTCLHADNGGVFGTTVGNERRVIRQVSAKGWT